MVNLSAIDKYRGHFSINLALSKLIMSPAKLTLVNVLVDLLVFTRIAGT